MAWLSLFVAALFEIAWALSLKYSESFTRFWPSLATLFTMAGGIYFLSLSLRTLPLGTAYTVWTGIGAIGTVILGITLFGESTAPARLAFVALIIIGILGLKLTSGTPS